MKFRGMTAFVFVSALLCMPLVVAAGEPTDQLSRTVDTLSGMLASAPRAAVTSDELPERVAKLIYERFDFAEMAKLSLGNYWERLSQNEQREFVDVFTTFVLRAYKSTLNSYSGEKISYEREVRDGDLAQVDTKVIGKSQTFIVDYKLHLLGGAWKVYDIAVEQVSMAKNFHSQFNRVIAESSFKNLIERMKGSHS